MLIVLIPIAWLAIIALVIAACRAAARGDEALTVSAPTDPSRPTPSPSPRWREGHAIAAGSRSERPLAFIGARRVERTRGTRCAAGS